MTLTPKDVAEITRLLEDSDFDELHLEIDGLKVSLRRGPDGSARPATALTEPPSPGVSAAPAARATGLTTSPAAPPARSPRIHDVPAPLLGTFYRAPKPGAPSFVEVGSQVEIDTIIGIVEVMKLMNTVRAGVRGTVTEILGRDGVLVEYGETLLRVAETA